MMAPLLLDRLVRPLLPQNLQGGEDGRQRIAEFVTEHGQKLVLALVQRL